MSIRCKVINGHLIPLDDIRWDDGEFVEITEVRSDPMFRLFWVWMHYLGNLRGYTAEEMKYWLFLGFGFVKEYKNHKTEQVFMKDESVSGDIPQKRLMQIMSRVHHFAMDHGIDLPDPDDYYQNFKNRKLAGKELGDAVKDIFNAEEYDPVGDKSKRKPNNNG
jgi:hypothetical protein